MKSRLGEVLLAHGWITRADLAKALETQRLLGGRLGTCLLDQGSLAEELLGLALAEVHGVEAAGAEDLLQAPEEITSLLPRKLAVRWRAVPFRAHGSRLDVAMADPGDLACQDELSFASSRRVQVFVAPEVRLAQALERIYGEEAPARLSALADRLDRGRRTAVPAAPADDGGAADREGAGRRAVGGPAAASGRVAAAGMGSGAAATGAGATGEAATGEAASGEAASRAAAAGAAARKVSEADGLFGEPAPAEGSPPPPPPPVRPARPTIVTLSEDERAALFGGPGGGGAAAAAALAGGEPAPEAPEELAFAEAVERLERAADRDEVGRLLLAFFSHHFDRVLLLGVRRDATTGWLGAGEGLDPRRVEALSIPFDRPSLFLNLRQGSAFHLGPLPPLPAHRGLLALLGGERPRECLVLPVHLGPRLVAALYADRGGDRLAGVDLESLRRLTDLAGAALERAILLKRQQKAGSSGG